jgi:hypothetical protein
MQMWIVDIQYLHYSVRILNHHNNELLLHCLVSKQMIEEELTINHERTRSNNASTPREIPVLKLKIPYYLS